ncbi:MAG: LLM class flavin-dependent oxidoreductase, partial [Proteobacteria bacterium]|nr:LLM class flavin-dependent oxidoreductase [Pseudomonadota bacterium]
MDYEAVGAPFEKRHARMDEQIAAMKKIWQGFPPLEGGDPVVPTPGQAGGRPMRSVTMVPKCFALAAE